MDIRIPYMRISSPELWLMLHTMVGAGSSSALAAPSSVVVPRAELGPSPGAATHSQAPPAPLQFEGRKVIMKLNCGGKRNSSASVLFSFPFSCLLLFCSFCIALFSIYNTEAHEVHYQARHDCTRHCYVNSSCCCKLQTSVPGPTRDGVSQMYTAIVCFSSFFFFNHLNSSLRFYFLL